MTHIGAQWRTTNTKVSDFLAASSSETMFNVSAVSASQSASPVLNEASIAFDDEMSLTSPFEVGSDDSDERSLLGDDEAGEYISWVHGHP